MSILLNAQTRVIVLGITGRYAASQTREMLAGGTKVVAGVSTGRGGESVHDVPVFDTFSEAMAEQPAEAAALHVGAAGVLDAFIETVEAGIELVYVGTEGVPPHDAMIMRAVAREHGAWMIGPNSLGLITPGEASLGGFPPEWFAPGRLGVVSRSGTLCLFVTSEITKAGFGQSTVVTIGGDEVIGRNPVEYLEAFEQDQDTDAVLFLSEVGGRKDYEAAEYIEQMSKPVAALLVGHAAPPGRRMGHIGAVAGDADESAAAKTAMLRAKGAHAVETYHELPDVLRVVLS